MPRRPCAPARERPIPAGAGPARGRRPPISPCLGSLFDAPRLGPSDPPPAPLAGRRSRSGSRVRAPFRIGERAVAPGRRAVVDLPIAMLSNHTPVVLSVLVIHGRRPGPTVFVSAALHGDEVLGVEVIRRLVRMEALEDLGGTLLAVPVVNAFGFLSLSRYLPDRRDLNRSFPGRPDGSLAARLADLFMREVVRRSDLGIDLHTGAVHRTNLPQLRVADARASSEARAEAFAPPVILRGAPPEGSLRAAAQAAGCPVLVYEAGEALRFDEIGVRVGLRGCLRVLAHEGMIDAGAVPPADGPGPVWLERSAWARAPQGGVVRNLVALGDTVREGEALAVVGDPFGQSEEPIPAPVTGVVIGRSELSTANRGDALFNVAMARNRAEVRAAIEVIEEEMDGPLLAAPPLGEEG